MFVFRTRKKDVTHIEVIVHRAPDEGKEIALEIAKALRKAKRKSKISYCVIDLPSITNDEAASKSGYWGMPRGADDEKIILKVQTESEGKSIVLQDEEELKKRIMKELNSDAYEVVIKKRTAKQSSNLDSKDCSLDNRNYI